MSVAYALPERFGNPVLRGMEEVILGPSAAWWPVAPGWWVLAGIVFFVLLRTVLRRLRQWFQDRYRREGLRALRHLESIGEPGNRAAACNELLKRVALATYPRPEIASLAGSGWVSWLESVAPSLSFSREVREALIFGPYSTQSCDPSLAPPALFSEIAQWISQHQRGDTHELH